MDLKRDMKYGVVKKEKESIFEKKIEKKIFKKSKKMKLETQNPKTFSKLITSQ